MATTGRRDDPLLSDPRSHGLWAQTAPPAPPTEVLAGDRTADVVVIGGGYTGLSTALHLAERGTHAIVLEGAGIGFGGSGRNVGLVNAGMWVMPSDLPAALGPEHGERLLSLLGDAPRTVFELIERYQIACEPERAGTLHCAAGAAGLRELERRAEQWLARGAPVRLLDAAETAAKLGSRAYAGALLDLRAGTIQPLAYARGLARAAAAAGAEIMTDSPVVTVESSGQRWTVRTAAGSVTADWVVVATDAYTQAPWSEIRAEQVHVPYFNFATAPLSPDQLATVLPERQGAWDTRRVMMSVRLDRAGHLVLGSVGALRGTGIAVHRAWARRALRKLFPHLGELDFVAEWYGTIGMTDNHLPRFHKLARNVVGFCGYNGRGIAPGTVFGRVTAELVTGAIREADLPLPVTQPKADALRAGKELYYEIGAQLAHLAAARI